MPLNRYGLGPVFAYEWITSSRRWQSYALRSCFVAFMLCALLFVRSSRTAPAGTTLRELAKMAELFFLAVSGTQLALILLAAPAATAGAICLDRARGTLSHMLMTDLSDVEIVLGKLAARLVPVIALLACMLPVMELLALLGGVEPTALLGSFAVALGVAVLGCSLAMFLSLWVGKTHEALMGTYAVWSIWLLCGPMIDLVGNRLGMLWIKPARTADPFFLALAPYWWPKSVAASDYVWFVAVTLVLSAALVAIAVLRLRAVCTREKVLTRPGRRLENTLRRLWRSLFGTILWLTPSLDGNPVLWREWHRNRPSPWSILIASVFAGLSLICSAAVIVWPGGPACAWVNGFQVSIALLLLSVAASTSLAEERARGSMDLLLTTPLTTWQIVVGKWLGAYRFVPLMAILPALVIGRGALATNWLLLWTPLLMIAYVLASGAAITSLGLAMATLFSRLGWAVAVTVTIYAFIAAGWLILATFVVAGPSERGVAMASPFFWPGEMTFDVSNRRGDIPFGWAIIWMFACAWAAAELFQYTLRQFERRLGRIEQPTLEALETRRLLRVFTRTYLVAAGALFVVGLNRDWASVAIALQFTVGTLLLLGVGTISALDPEKPKRLDSEIATGPARRRFLPRWARAYRGLVPVTVPSILLVLLMARADGHGLQFLVLVFYFVSVGAAFVNLGVALSVRSRRRHRPIVLVLISWALVNAAWLGLAGALGGESSWAGLAASMGSPFLAVAILASDLIGPGNRFAGAAFWALIWCMGYMVASAFILRKTWPEVRIPDPSSLDESALAQPTTSR